MAAHTTFSFFKPGLLATEGYCYGRASLPHDAAPANSINVDRVSSGRWRDLSDATFPLPSSDVALRTVSEGEAASGIGTYVGSCVCIARASHNRGPSWDYGAVSGYSWDPNTSSGALHVSFESGVEPVQFRHTEIQHLAYVPYALRPCIGRLVCDLMTAEMEHLHDSAHNHFRGVRTRATRRSKTILDKLHAPLIDETKAVPLFDSSTGSIREVTTKYLLDFMYYKEGGRRTPRNLVLGDSVFDEPMSNVTANPETESSAVGTPLVPLVDHDLLSDSDDDDDPVVASPMAIAVAETTRVQPPTVPRSSRKRARDDASDDIDSLVALRETYTRNPTMIRNIDRLISMNQTPGDERSFQSLSAPTTDSQAQFRPTAMQRQIHRHLVNGTYACMSAQLLLETLQISLQTLDLLPHPAVIRAFFSWDFATQGLSVMHFVSLSDVERRERRSASDMSDFSRKNKLPRPSAAGDLATVVDALGGLAAVVKIAYQPFVSTLVEEAQVFVRKLSRSTLGRNFGIPTARSELVNWIDERFECVRLLLAQGHVDAAQAVHGAFQEGDASFAKLIQVVSECRLTHSEKQMAATATRNGPSNNTRGAQPRHEFRRKVKEVKHERPEITADMVQMLPELNGKRLCMKYLSKMGCPSRRERCFSRRRGHFRPDNIPATIRDLIVQHYGGFKPELADITVVPDPA